MIPRKRKTTLVLKKFLRENKNILKELEKEFQGKTIYS